VKTKRERFDWLQFLSLKICIFFGAQPGVAQMRIYWCGAQRGVAQMRFYAFGEGVAFQVYLSREG
jgi:hypothetical protein